MSESSKKLSNGGMCYRIIMLDEDNEVRVHVHFKGKRLWDSLEGLTVKSAKMGTLFWEGDVVGDCD